MATEAGEWSTPSQIGASNSYGPCKMGRHDECSGRFGTELCNCECHYLRERWEDWQIEEWTQGGYLPSSYAIARRQAEAREEEIRQIEEEIKWIEKQMFCHPRAHLSRLDDEQRAIGRILARETAALAELRKGWKGDKVDGGGSTIGPERSPKR